MKQNLTLSGMFFLPLLFAFFAQKSDVTTNTTAAPAEYWKVDTRMTTTTWKAYKVTGEHAGTVGLKTGSLTTNNGVLTGGSFSIDMTSMKCTDLTGEYADKLMGHLKSDDFFSVEKHPVANFLITKVASRGKAGEYKVTGTMSIKGISKEIKFDATFNDGKGTAAIKLDRTDFDVRYGSGSFFDGLGDKTIYDEFDINVNLVATK